MKPRITASKFRTAQLGASLVTSIVVCLSGSAFAADNLWTGTTSSDWNDGTNWSLGRVPVKDVFVDNAVINTNTGNIATITANISAVPQDILVGLGGATNGRLDHRSATASTGSGNWMVVGREGGVGVYNLADTSVVDGGNITGYGQGTGTMNVGGEFQVGSQSNGQGTLNVNTTGSLNVPWNFFVGRSDNGGGCTGVLNLVSGNVNGNSQFIIGEQSTGTVTVNGGKIFGGNEFWVGQGGDGNGTLVLNAGEIQTTNWTVVARAGSDGNFTMNGGTLTKTGGGRTIIGDGGGSVGVMTQNGGAVTLNDELWVGQGGGTGTMNLNGGSITSNSWVAIGREGGNGTVNHTGGSWTKTGGGVFIVGDNSPAVYHLSGTGTLTATELWVGQAGSGNATMNMGAGTSISVSGWTVIGRDNGTGVFNMTGGTVTKTGGGQFIVGANGTGTMTMSGGLVDVQNGFTWVGEGNNRPAILTLSGSAEFRTSTMSVGQNTNGTLNLNGGTIRTQRFIGAREADDTGVSAGNATINFNGSQVIATANNSLNFISTTVDNAVIGTGGLLLDSNGFNLVAPKGLSGTGGLVKTGSGSLTLSGVNSYAGSNTVNAGKLTLNGDSSGTGSITLADGTALGINQANPANSLDPTNVTFGTAGATTLDLNLGNFSGNPSAAPLNVTGTLTLNGTVTLNVADQFPAIGSIPLVSYVGPKAGAGSFVLGTLPEGVSAVLNDDGTGLVSLVVSNATLPKWDGTDAPKYAKTADVTSGLFDVVVTDDTNIAIGQKVFGAGIPAGTLVTAISGTTITLDQAATATNATASLVFTTGVGSNDGVWDISTTDNWINQISGANSDFPDPDFPALFNDSATGPTSVVLDTTVTPSSVTFANSTLPYTLSGTGKITGSTGVTKSGTAALTVSTDNDYTGVTRLEGGTTSVATLTNGGVAGPLGAASSDPANLALAGGTLDYTGGAVSIDRGVSVSAVNNTIASTLNLAADVTTSGQVTASLGKLTKSGPGTLTLTNTGANVLAEGSGGETPQALRVSEGGLALTGAGQTNLVNGWAAVGTTASSTSSLTINNGATMTVNGRLQSAMGAGSTASLTISGSSALQTSEPVQLGLGAGSSVNVLIENSGSLNKTGGWFSLGHDAANTVTMTVRDSGSLSGTGGDLNVGDTGTATGILNLENNANVSWAGSSVYVGKNTTTGTLNMSGDSNLTSGNTDIGGGNTSSGTLNMSGTSNYASGGRLQVGPGAGSIGTVLIEGSAGMTVNSYVSVGFGGEGIMTLKDNATFSNTDDFSVNESGDDPAVVTVQDNASLSAVRTIFVGRNYDTGNNVPRVGTLNVTGAAIVNQTDAAYSFHVGPAGAGTLNISGTAAVNIASNDGMVITNSGTGTGTVNLDGGTLTTKRVSDNGGTSTFNFNGGVLKAGTGASLNFLSGVDTVTVGIGGAFIDSNGETIAINKVLSNGGGNLTKQGAGTLQLNMPNSYPGSTTVAAGTLGGTGSVGGELIVPAGSSIAPGAGGVGTFSAGDTLAMGSTIAGTYVCEISGATADKLVIGDALDVTGATLDFSTLSAPTAVSYDIATFASLSGTFIEQNVPAGFEVVYNATSIKLKLIPTPYSTWASSFGLNPLTDGAPGVDKDNDGQSNMVEFALGGDPTSGSNNAKIYNLVADSDADGDATNELILTIAVRAGTPAFAGSPSPSATMDAATYVIQGSTDLGSFTTTVNSVSPVTSGLPAAPAGYEYRSFSLNGSNGMPNKGFLRAQINF